MTPKQRKQEALYWRLFGRPIGKLPKDHPGRHIDDAILRERSAEEDATNKRVANIGKDLEVIYSAVATAALEAFTGTEFCQRYQQSAASPYGDRTEG